MNPANKRRGFFGILTFFFSCLAVYGQTGPTNTWVRASGGNWEEASAWSLGVPTGGQSVRIANPGWKAVQLTHSTAVDFPTSMTVGSITVASPQDTMNTLLLNNVGVGFPLTANEITVG